MKHVIFDMDGVLIDSEHFWQQAEDTVFASLGMDPKASMFKDTWGLRTDEVVALKLREYPQIKADVHTVSDAIDSEVIRLIRARGEPLSGVHDAIAHLRRLGLTLGLATSSSYPIIDAVLARLGLEDTFRITHSAHDEEFGKPHPAVYISAYRKLGADPRETFAIEDSLNGLIAARAAKLRTVIIPSAKEAHLPVWVLGEVKLKSLSELPNHPAFLGV